MKGSSINHSQAEKLDRLELEKSVELAQRRVPNFNSLSPEQQTSILALSRPNQPIDKHLANLIAQKRHAEAAMHIKWEDYKLGNLYASSLPPQPKIWSYKPEDLQPSQPMLRSTSMSLEGLFEQKAAANAQLQTAQNQYQKSYKEVTAGQKNPSESKLQCEPQKELLEVNRAQRKVDSCKGQITSMQNAMYVDGAASKQSLVEIKTLSEVYRAMHGLNVDISIGKPGYSENSFPISRAKGNNWAASSSCSSRVMTKAEQEKNSGLSSYDKFVSETERTSVSMNVDDSDDLKNRLKEIAGTTSGVAKKGGEFLLSFVTGLGNAQKHADPMLNPGASIFTNETTHQQAEREQEMLQRGEEFNDVARYVYHNPGESLKASWQIFSDDMQRTKKAYQDARSKGDLFGAGQIKGELVGDFTIAGIGLIAGGRGLVEAAPKAMTHLYDVGIKRPIFRNKGGNIGKIPEHVGGADGKPLMFSEKSKMDFAPTGFKDAQIYPVDKMPILGEYLRKRGVNLFPVEYLPKGMQNPAFTSSYGATGKPTIFLPRDATVLEVKHELSHYLDYRSLGKQSYDALGMYQKEKMVLDRLKENRIWEQLTKAEKQFSERYVESKKPTVTGKQNPEKPDVK